MKKLLRKIIKKIFSPPQERNEDKLIKRGVIKHGVGCDLSMLNVCLADDDVSETQIIIGDNCCVRATIILYRKESKIIIGNNVYVGQRTIFECVEKINIGNDVLVSSDCNLIDTNSHSVHSVERVDDIIDWQKGLKYKNWNVVKSSTINISNNCWVGLRSIITKGVNLGKGTIVASGSVVTKSTEPFSVVGGNPAVFIKQTD